jgi:hypothetical protein
VFLQKDTTMKNFAAITLLVFLSFSCQSPNGPSGVNLGESFRLSYQESAAIQHTPLVMTFKAVHDDSRCPKDAECFWQGNAGILFSVSGTDVLLNTTLDPQKASYRGYNIRLIAVEPNRTVGGQLNPSDYIVTVVVNTQ